MFSSVIPVKNSFAFNGSKSYIGWGNKRGISRANQKTFSEVIDDNSVALKTKKEIDNIEDKQFKNNLEDEGVFAALKQSFAFIPMTKPINNNNNKKKKGFVWPVDVKAKQRITSKFGVRTHPVTKRRKKHKGLDIAAKSGTKVLASKSGCVILASRLSGYGKVIKLRHDDGRQTLYGHLSRINVKKGQNVKAGQKIGRVGRTGRVTGSHLHFEVREGKKMTAINPLKKLSIPRKVAQNGSVILSRR